MKRMRFQIHGDRFEFLHEKKLKRRITTDGMKPNDQKVTEVWVGLRGKVFGTTPGNLLKINCGPAST